MKFSECGCGRWSTTILVIASISQTNVLDVWLLFGDFGFCIYFGKYDIQEFIALLLDSDITKIYVHLKQRGYIESKASHYTFS